MAEIAINRMILDVAGAAPVHPERLAERIAQGLAQAALPVLARELSALTVSVAPIAGEDDDRLAARIVAQVLRQLDLER
jgi:hypothetical protein